MKTVTDVSAIKTSVDEAGWVVIELTGNREVLRLRAPHVMAKLVAEQISKTAEEAYVRRQVKEGTVV